MRKRKEWDMRKQTLDTGVYPVVRLATKVHLATSMLLKHSLRVLLLGNQVSSADSTMVTLILISTKELLHKGWGSPRPPHKDRPRRSTPSRKVVDVAGELQSSKGPAHQNIFFGSQENHITKAQSLACSLSKELT